MLSHSLDEDLCDCLVIAFGVAVHPAHALIVTRDDLRHIAFGHDIGPIADDPGAGRQVGLMCPVSFWQRTGEQALTDSHNLGVSRK